MIFFLNGGGKKEQFRCFERYTENPLVGTSLLFVKEER
jgi:hypothetical protein